MTRGAPAVGPVALLVVLATVALVLRILGALDPLWLDEIWSLERALAVDGWRGVFTSIHSDNNHWLVSLWLRALGDERPEWALRLPSTVLGALSVPAAWLAGRRRAGAAAGGVAAGVVAIAYPLVHYGSEARGYAPAIFFLLASVWLLERFADGGRRRDAIGFAAAATLGVASHLTFTFALAALAADRLLRPGPRRSRALVPFLVPLSALALLFVVDLRHWTVAGGDPLPAGRGLADATAWLVGARPGGAGALVTAGLLLVASLRSSRRAGDVTALLLPWVAATAAGAAYVPPRYFVVPLVLPLLALAELAADALRRGGRAGRVAVGIGAAFFLLHQSFFLREFLEHGRGPTRTVIETMLRTSRNPEDVTVAFDFAPRGETVVRHHARLRPGGAALRVVEPGTEAPPEFRLHHVFAGGPDVGDRFVDAAGHAYVLVRRDDHFGLSGWTWLLYRRAT
ncbi:MAG: glycosyltransferase family 39 protein [Planctomycetota bacterium JB042]